MKEITNLIRKVSNGLLTGFELLSFKKKEGEIIDEDYSLLGIILISLGSILLISRYLWMKRSNEEDWKTQKSALLIIGIMLIPIGFMMFIVAMAADVIF